MATACTPELSSYMSDVSRINASHSSPLEAQDGPGLIRLPLGVKEEGITLNDKEEARRLLGIPPLEFVLLYFGRLSVENKCDFHPLIA